MTTIKHDRMVLDNLCVVSRDISKRILTCEQRGRESSKVSYEDLILWFDCLSDAIEVVHRRLEEADVRKRHGC